LQNFPQLEIFTCSFISVGYVFPYGLAHRNLKKLSISEFEISINLLFLFGCLENLEAFKIGKIDWQDLQMILSAKKLKVLCVTFPVLGEKFVGTLKMLGKNLESFHAQQVYEEDYVDLSPEELREEFKEQFPIFSLKPGKKSLMKKSNKPMICCSF
jgi:hypothetical protein